MEIFTGKQMVDHLIGLHMRGVDVGFAFILFPPPAGLEDEVREHAFGVHPAEVEAIVSKLAKVRQMWSK